jgi:hypothetical protein
MSLNIQENVNNPVIMQTPPNEDVKPVIKKIADFFKKMASGFPTLSDMVAGLPSAYTDPEEYETGLRLAYASAGGCSPINLILH